MDDLIKALEKHQAEFGLQLGAGTISRLSQYYELVLKHNPLLHLVGPAERGRFCHPPYSRIAYIAGISARKF